MNNLKRNISFDAASHTYKDEYNLPYISVTTLIEKYAPKFDVEYWAKKKAQELGTTPEIIKGNWKDITKVACDKGNVEHKLLEDSITGAQTTYDGEYNKEDVYKGLNIVINKINLYLLTNSPLAIKYPRIYEYLKEKIEDGWSLHCEKRIYWAEFQVAGTIDLLLIKQGYFIIVDWKTNKDTLHFRSGYYKKVNGIKTNQWVDKKEYMFKPINHLEHCKGIKYTLQLSMYAYIMELWGYKCVAIRLFHIPNELNVTHYDLKYEQKSVELLLIDNKNKNVYNSNNKTIQNNVTNFGIT